MSDSQEKLIPSSLWGGAVVVLAVVVVLLLVTDRRAEPSAAFRYDIGKFQEVDPSLIIFRETGKLVPGLERLTALAAGSDEKIYVAGDAKIVVYNLDGAELRRIPLTQTPDCIAVAPDGAMWFAFAWLAKGAFIELVGWGLIGFAIRRRR